MKGENAHVAGSEEVKMGYGFTPSAGKKDYTQNPDFGKLQEFFGIWIETIPFEGLIGDTETSMNDIENRVIESLYNDCVTRIKGIPGVQKMEPEEINALILPYKGNSRIVYSGLFLSACHNLIESDKILLDVETEYPIGFIGMKLPRNKGLVIKNDTCFSAGDESHGTIINYGKSKVLGQNFSGIVINSGKCEYIGDCSSGIYFTFGKSRASGHIGNIEHYVQVFFHTVYKRWFMIDHKAWNNEIDVLEGIDEIKRASVEEYIESLKRRVEIYRNIEGPQSLSVLDLVRHEIGSRDDFLNKINGMLE